MMTDEQRTLSRRLVACPQWQEHEAMMVCTPGGQQLGRPCGGIKTIGWLSGEPRIPDPSDFATAAILLRMAMEADQWICAGLTDEGWDVADTRPYWGNLYGAEGHSEPDLGTAAARALLACWEGEE